MLKKLETINADGKTLVRRDKWKIQERGWMRKVRFLNRCTPSLWKWEDGETPSDSFCMLSGVEGQASTESGKLGLKEGT